MPTISASRGDEQLPKWRVHAAFFLRCSYELFRCYDVAQRSIGTGNMGLILVGNTPYVHPKVGTTEARDAV